MSESVSPLEGAVYRGFVEVSEVNLQGMILLRGNLSNPTLEKAVNAATGVAVPGQRQIVMKDGRGAAWMSPDELLLLVPCDEAGAIAADLGQALAGVHSLVVDVSDARVVIRLRGAGARETLAKLAPVDFSKGAFESGQIRRSRLAQVSAAFWMSEEDEFTVIASRSVAEYVFNLLRTSAIPGSEVGYP